MLERLPNEIQLKIIEKCKTSTVFEVAKLNQFYKNFVEKHEPHLKHAELVRLKVRDPAWTSNTTFSIEIDEQQTIMDIPTKNITDEGYAIFAEHIKPMRSINILDISRIQLTEKVLEILENCQLRMIKCLRFSSIDDKSNLDGLGAFLKKKVKEVHITSNDLYVVLTKENFLSKILQNVKNFTIFHSFRDDLDVSNDILDYWKNSGLPKKINFTRYFTKLTFVEILDFIKFVINCGQNNHHFKFGAVRTLISVNDYRELLRYFGELGFKINTRLPSNTIYLKFTRAGPKPGQELVFDFGVPETRDLFRACCFHSDCLEALQELDKQLELGLWNL